MGPRKGHDHHDGPARLALLCLPEEGQGVVGDQVRQIVLSIVPTVPDLVSVHVECVVVEPGIPDQTRPLVPTLGDVVAIVLVQILAEIA